MLFGEAQCQSFVRKVRGALLIKGYRIVRSERMLFVLSSEDELPDNFATTIEESKLDGCGEFEIVQCQFQLTKITAEEAEIEVKKLLTHFGKVVVLSKAKQLVVTDYASKLKQVRSAIKSIENPPTPKTAGVTIVKLEHIRAGEFMTLARDTLGIPAALNAMPDGSLRAAVRPRGHSGSPDCSRSEERQHRRPLPSRSA